MTTILDAENIIKNHQKETPVQVIPIANALGLNVYKIENWGDNLSGKLQKDESSDAGFSIYVNANHSETRKRFTIAHEIAHYVLHRHLIEGEYLIDDTLYRSGLSNSIEAAANKMAAEILMPWRLVDRTITGGTNKILDLAKTFQVSPSAMSIRLGVPAEF